MYTVKISEIKEENMILEEKKRIIINDIADIERQQLVNQGKIDMLEELKNQK